MILETEVGQSGPNENERARKLRNSENVYDWIIGRPILISSWQHHSEDILSLNGVICGVVKLHPRVLSTQADFAEACGIVKQWADDHLNHPPSAEITQLVHDTKEQSAVDLLCLFDGSQRSDPVEFSKFVDTPNILGMARSGRSDWRSDSKPRRRESK